MRQFSPLEEKWWLARTLISCRPCRVRLRPTELTMMAMKLDMSARATAQSTKVLVVSEV